VKGKGIIKSLMSNASLTIRLYTKPKIIEIRFSKETLKEKGLLKKISLRIITSLTKFQK
jgi:hypothetical protein